MYVTGTNNRLLEDGTFEYTYDDEGNQIERRRNDDTDIWTFEYDLNNQLISAEHKPNDAASVDQTITFEYDVFGNRIERDEDGTVTLFAYSGSNAWADLDGTSSLTTRRCFGVGVDSLLARISGTVLSFYLTDRLGSVREISNGTDGSLVYEVTYGGFGNIELEIGLGGDRYKFTGREIEIEFGLYYYRARYYDPATGRFTSEDPIGMADDANLYRYVGNNATNRVDPSGLKQKEQEERIHFDPQRIPEHRVNAMIRDGFAQKDEKTGYVAITDVVGMSVVTYLLKPYIAQRRLDTPPTNVISPLDGPVVLPPGKYENYTYYKLVKIRRHNPSLAELKRVPLAERVKRRRADETLAGRLAAVYEGEQKQRHEDEFMVVFVFYASMIPGGAAGIHLANKEYLEASLSYLGDIATAGLLSKLRFIRLASEAGTLTVGAIRTGQGIFAFMEGDRLSAAGYLGEATLRLFGVSASFLRASGKNDI